MKQEIEKFLKNFSSCFQLAQMYGCQHPGFDKALSETYQSLQVVLSGQKELNLALVAGELTSGDDIFFDLSKRLTTLINKFIGKGFEKITFFGSVSKEELRGFFLFLLDSDSENNNIEDCLKVRGIQNIQLNKIREFSSQGDKQKNLYEKDMVKALYSQSVSNLSSSLSNLIQNQSVDITRFSSVVDNLMKGVGYHYQEILKLSKIKGKDAITFAHLLNVSFLAMHFSKYLGFNNSESREIGLASLFHDIGKLYISSKILKGGKLTDKEFEQIKSHSLLGADILLKFVDKLGELAPVVALEHHLKFNIGGYPKLQFPRRLHPISMLVSLCDVYDALSQRRSYKNSFPPEQIYKIMKEGRGTQFHPELFDNFFEFMGAWPNGTIVLLSNGKIGRVVGQNFDNIFAPKVKIVSETLDEVVDLNKDGITVKIEKSLNPYKEGKDYLKL
jgi:HD-GYP domain-containing protein (c-di-GMP phosphodiesterase class II)